MLINNKFMYFRAGWTATITRANPWGWEARLWVKKLQLRFQFQRGWFTLSSEWGPRYGHFARHRPEPRWSDTTRGHHIPPTPPWPNTTHTPPPKRSTG
jgi:hypothetical protein